MFSTTAPLERPATPAWRGRVPTRFLTFTLVLLAVLLAVASWSLASGLGATAGRPAQALRPALWTLGAGALAAALLAWWIARRFLEAARHLRDMAERINIQALHEQVPVGGQPPELAPAAEALNDMLERLLRAFDRQSAFPSELAHDLRAPLHRLQMGAQVTLSQPRSADDYRRVLESAVADYERIGRIIDNVLFLARAASAQAALHPGWVDGPQRLTAIGEFFEPLAAEQGLQLVVQVPQALPLWADEMLMTRAVGNLLGNALRHARRGSAVVLSAQALEDGGVRVGVANEGEPIAPELQEAIFERHYRAPGPAPAGGAGLGLAIVRSVMVLHGGRAAVASAPGRPTVFTLEFPAATPASS